jgi:Ca-activated chloride channel family protein
MIFAHENYLYYIWWLLAGAVLLVLYVYWHKGINTRIAQPHLINKILKSKGVNIPVYSGILVLTALLFLLIGLANPQTTGEKLKGKKPGLDIIIALDISRSMDAEDVKPSRLERAKAFAARLSDSLGADRIGLVVFAGHAYVQMPLSSDHAAVRMFLDAVTTDMAPTQGTAIGEAVRVSYELLNPPGQQQPVKGAQTILLFSDGETHDEDALDEARAVADKGVRLYTIGVGREEGAPVPNHGDDKEDMLRDANGQVVISKLDENMLRDLAEEGKGSFYRLVRDEGVMQGLERNLAALDKTEKDVTLYSSYKSHFQWFLGAGLALFLIEFGITYYSKGKETYQG